jgi:hypothetical protein
MVSCVVVVFLNAKIYVFVLYKMAFHFLIFNLERHQRELFSPGQLQWLLPTTTFTRKSVQKKNNPLCLYFDRFWHWKPCYYYIYWTLFSAHWLCYIHIDTTSSDCGSRDYPFYFVLGYQSVSVASYSDSCLNRIENKMASCINWSLNSVPI